MILKIILTSGEAKISFLDDIERVNVSFPQNFVLSYRDEKLGNNGIERIIGCYKQTDYSIENGITIDESIGQPCDELCIDYLHTHAEIDKQLQKTKKKWYEPIKMLNIRYRDTKKGCDGREWNIIVSCYTEVYLLNDNGKTIEKLG